MDTKNNVRIFIQARMSSSRYPGKVLAPIRGRPIIAHLLARLMEWTSLDKVVVLTSDCESDDPLVSYLSSIGTNVVRGSLDDVFERYRKCLQLYPCQWFFRVCADSPFYDVSIMKKAEEYCDRMNLDLITNIQKRTYPKGHSVEVVKSSTFMNINDDKLTEAQKEHVTKVYYENPDKYNILNIESSDPGLKTANYCVDTVEDLMRLSKTSHS
jgi:spore coat polysaccharide biosynthesis protein SpsF